MSKAKFAAAKELIDEKNYDVARSILKTIDDPLAKKWLSKLDKIKRPTKETEQEEYYRRQNAIRRRSNLGSGIMLIISAIVLVGMGIAFTIPVPSFVNGTPQTINLSWLCFTLPLAIFALAMGVRRIRHR